MDSIYKLARTGTSKATGMDSLLFSIKIMTVRTAFINNFFPCGSPILKIQTVLLKNYIMVLRYGVIKL